LISIFQDQSKIFTFKTLIKFVSYNDQIINDLEFFKIRNLPVAPFVANRLEQLESFLLYNLQDPYINQEIDNPFSSNVIHPSCVDVFKETFTLAYQKLKKIFTIIMHYPF
jgi:hypothetical protein